MVVIEVQALKHLRTYETEVSGRETCCSSRVITTATSRLEFSPAGNKLDLKPQRIERCALLPPFGGEVEKSHRGPWRGWIEIFRNPIAAVLGNVAAWFASFASGSAQEGLTWQVASATTSR
jgi:hypothetical protein